MDAAIPAIEITNDADARRVRRPYRERDSVSAVDCTNMRAELIEDPIVAALAP